MFLFRKFFSSASANASHILPWLRLRKFSTSLRHGTLPDYAQPSLMVLRRSISNATTRVRTPHVRRAQYRPFLFALNLPSQPAVAFPLRSPFLFNPTRIATRSISFLPFRGPLGRLPLLLAGSLASGLAYLQYKMTASSQWLYDQVHKTKSKLTEYIDTFSDSLQPLQTQLQKRLLLFKKTSPLEKKDGAPSNLHAEHHSSEHELSSSKARHPEVGKKGSQSTVSTTSKNEELVDLTKQIIHIRTLLNNVKISGNLVLPNIVVIGSQSSGKTSLLETLVGQSFLPKGKNMVTRRPLELNLIHTPEAEQPYADLPQLGLKGLTNFQHLQQTLTDLNLAVEGTCISEEPIQLNIYAAHVPNLSLVDLPGYIQIHAQHQPASLKENIAQVCEKYIQEPNIILAVCAADVDLANAEALRAARRADPRGERTIGVLTKMDLVDPQTKQQLLQITQKDYPLALGYVGMSNKADTDSALFTPFGLIYLKQLLVRTLETHLQQRLFSLTDSVKKELGELNYQYKVMYNDRSLTPETYMAEAFDLFKQHFKEFEKHYGRTEVSQTVRDFLDRKITELCGSTYWQPHPSSFSDYTHAQMELACSALTKSGIGMATTQLVTDKIKCTLRQVLEQEPFLHHPGLRSTFIELYHRLLEKQFRVTVDQVENVLKPYKFEIQCTANEWQESIPHAIQLIESETQKTKNEMTLIQRQLGRRQLRRVMSHIKHNQTESVAPEVLERAQQLIKANQHVSLLQSRLKQLQSRACRKPNPACPEVMLSAIANQLAQTASVFIYIELLHEFYFQFPRELDTLFLYNYTKEQIHALANENPVIQKQLELFHRKSVLENVAAHLDLLTKEKLARKRPN